ncbi:MAG: nucleotidyltransferase family protein [Clostridia bacterium]|nr:nucleotidyltransferase family protein [Clostridia bacterium]
MNYGIIAEFNPFHNGHRYIVNALKSSADDTVTAVMSGSFVQRGECACVSVSDRVKMALSNGVDLVLSLPVPYSTASAELFAKGGVDVLFSTGVIDALGFGGECDSADALVECVEVMNTPDFQIALKNRLDEGNSFPKARQMAFVDCDKSACADAIATPNNILGVEYIKAILNGGYADLCSITERLKVIKRQGVAHDSSHRAGDICSASALREMLKGGEAYKDFLPSASYSLLAEAVESGKAPADYKRLETAILYKLRTMSVEEIALLPDVTEGLEHRIAAAVKSSVSLDEILEKIKTKRYTHSRLRRIILCALLGITKADAALPVPYVRVLGFNSNGARLLKEMKGRSTLPIVTKKADLSALGADAQRVFELECCARDIFSLALPVPDESGKEMTDKIVIF